LILPLSADRRALTFEDFIGLDAVSDPQISPDGSTVAFVVTDYSLETNRGNSDIWLANLAGGEPKRLTAGTGATAPAGRPTDGRSRPSDRGGEPQIYLIRLRR
jgi:Tol biopolymer transport system component